MLKAYRLNTRYGFNHCTFPVGDVPDSTYIDGRLSTDNFWRQGVQLFHLQRLQVLHGQVLLQDVVTRIKRLSFRIVVDLLFRHVVGAEIRLWSKPGVSAPGERVVGLFHTGGHRIGLCLDITLTMQEYGENQAKNQMHCSSLSKHGERQVTDLMVSQQA